MSPTAKNIGEVYDQASDKYDQKWHDYLEFTHQKLLAELPKDRHPRKILDIGCGTGLLLEKLQLRYPEAELFGIDISQKMLGQAQARLPEAFLDHTSLESYKPGLRFDLIVSTSVLHYLEINTFFRNIRRLMKRSGSTICVDYCRELWFGVVNEAFNHLYEPQQAYSRAEVSLAADQHFLSTTPPQRFIWRWYVLQSFRVYKNYNCSR